MNIRDAIFDLEVSSKVYARIQELAPDARHDTYGWRSRSLTAEKCNAVALVAEPSSLNPAVYLTLCYQETYEGKNIQIFPEHFEAPCFMGTDLNATLLKQNTSLHNEVMTFLRSHGKSYF
jgi:hypothetical protein